MSLAWETTPAGPVEIRSIRIAAADGHHHHHDRHWRDAKKKRRTSEERIPKPCQVAVQAAKQTAPQTGRE